MPSLRQRSSLLEKLVHAESNSVEGLFVELQLEAVSSPMEDRPSCPSHFPLRSQSYDAYEEYHRQRTMGVVAHILGNA